MGQKIKVSLVKITEQARLAVAWPQKCSLAHTFQSTESITSTLNRAHTLTL